MNARDSISSVFRFKQFDVINCVKGLKIGTDAVLLGAWVQPVSDGHVWDIGCGTGVIALMVAQRCQSPITGFEIEPDAACMAQRNFERSPWAGRLRCVAGDAMVTSASFPDPMLIVSNPPYYAKGAAIAAIGKERDMARRDGSLSFESLIALSAARLTDRGEVAFISPYALKADIEWFAALHGLSVRRITSITSRDGQAPLRLLWQLSKSRCLTTERSELTIRNADGSYTAGYIDLTRKYYLNF